MLYKMIYLSSHKFAFSNLRFSLFYEHFCQLREKYAFKLKIKYNYTMLISSKSPIWWCTHICLFLKKTIPPIENILLHVNPFHCFFAKSLWAGKKLYFCLIIIIILIIRQCSINIISVYHMNIMSQEPKNKV